MPSDVDVFILAGQSNMAGRGELWTSPSPLPHPRVHVWAEPGQWQVAEEPLFRDTKSQNALRRGQGAGLAATFAKAIAATSDRNVGLVPLAAGSSWLVDWSPGGQKYNLMVRQTRRALSNCGARSRLRAILWHQGEADAEDGDLCYTYAARFAAAMKQLRKDLAAPDLPVVVGELGSFIGERATAPRQFLGTWAGKCEAYDALSAALGDAVRLAQPAALASAEGLESMGDLLHFDARSLRKFGERYARVLLALEQGKLEGDAKGREVRRDPAHRLRYHREQFIAYYGEKRGQEEWDKAEYGKDCSVPTAAAISAAAVAVATIAGAQTVPVLPPETLADLTVLEEFIPAEEEGWGDYAMMDPALGEDSPYNQMDCDYYGMGGDDYAACGLPLYEPWPGEVQEGSEDSEEGGDRKRRRTGLVEYLPPGAAAAGLPMTPQTPTAPQAPPPRWRGPGVGMGSGRGKGRGGCFSRSKKLGEWQRRQAEALSRERWCDTWTDLEWWDWYQDGCLPRDRLAPQTPVKEYFGNAPCAWAPSDDDHEKWLPREPPTPAPKIVPVKIPAKPQSKSDHAAVAAGGAGRGGVSVAAPTPNGPAAAAAGAARPGAAAAASRPPVGTVLIISGFPGEPPAKTAEYFTQKLQQRTAEPQAGCKEETRSGSSVRVKCADIRSAGMLHRVINLDKDYAELTSGQLTAVAPTAPVPATGAVKAPAGSGKTATPPSSAPSAAAPAGRGGVSGTPALKPALPGLKPTSPAVKTQLPPSGLKPSTPGTPASVTLKLPGPGSPAPAAGAWMQGRAGALAPQVQVVPVKLPNRCEPPPASALHYRALPPKVQPPAAPAQPQRPTLPQPIPRSAPGMPGPGAM
eukprot:TRINITY_DN10753_c0_g1_i1.p1 TRINITY_DN10753_c0_g1~~TRINITY_DN10753_c0_g1_i1.p1  ORF type:complete len:859 (+),score=197.09 TRINITY_DN10753_c0_g1_i1:101-2677(+)